METTALLTITFALLSLLCLLALHFASPEYAPSWRMISEYALGRHKWLLTSFFILWALSSLCLALALAGKLSGGWAMFGIVLLVLSAIGEAMGGLFDVKHKLHGLAFGLGIPTLPVAALIIGYNLPTDGQQTIITLASHAPWISLVLMGAAMGLMFSGFKKAGLAMGPDAPVPDSLPEGVIGIGGYANRLLVLCYIGWLIIVAAYIS